MKTKAEIVQELLDKSQITAEEAVTLLIGTKEYVYIPAYPVLPYQTWPLYPSYPAGPAWITNPFQNYSSEDITARS